MASATRHAHDEPLSEINVTPLVDVMLVLLVIFILAAPLMAQAISVDLPQAKGETLSEPPLATLEIRRDGELLLDGFAIAKEGVAIHLSAHLTASPDLVLKVAADGETPFRAVAEAMGLARQGGVHNIAFATRDQ